MFSERNDLFPYCVSEMKINLGFSFSVVLEELAVSLPSSRKWPGDHLTAHAWRHRARQAVATVCVPWTRTGVTWTEKMPKFVVTGRSAGKLWDNLRRRRQLAALASENQLSGDFCSDLSPVDYPLSLIFGYERNYISYLLPITNNIVGN